MSALDHLRKAALASAAKSEIARGPQEQQAAGVEVDGDRVTINLGSVPPFTIDKSSAMKFALLILKKCGVQINFE